MKHQYFGDINDYRKYGLLRILSNNGKLKTAVCWMLSSDDGKKDGGKISYLGKPRRWRKYDPELFDKLNDCVNVKRERSVQLAEQIEIIPGARYYTELLQDAASEREKYFAGFMQMAQGSDLVFFDQDNGMEIQSVQYGKKNSSKYLYWHELVPVYDAGYSVLLYQHYPRVKHDEFRNKMFRDVCDRMDVLDVIMFSTSSVLFVLVPQEELFSWFTHRAMLIQQVWFGEIACSAMRLGNNMILETVEGDAMTQDQADAAARMIAGWMVNGINLK